MGTVRNPQDIYLIDIQLGQTTISCLDWLYVGHQTNTQTTLERSGSFPHDWSNLVFLLACTQRTNDAWPISRTPKSVKRNQGDRCQLVDVVENESLSISSGRCGSTIEYGDTNVCSYRNLCETKGLMFLRIILLLHICVKSEECTHLWLCWLCRYVSLHLELSCNNTTIQ